MSDLISRQAAIRWVKTECNPYGKPALDFESGKKVIEHLKQMPSAEPRKEGKWLLIDAGYYDYVKCSQCGETLVWGKNFCPNCGCDMRERVKRMSDMMTFTINDADLDKLNEILKDINVKECPWFEVQDKYGVKAKYYREPRWIPCSERLPDESNFYMVTNEYDEVEIIWFSHKDDYDIDKSEWRETDDKIIAWMPLPEPYVREGKEE